MAKKELKICQQKARDLRYQSYEELLATYDMDPSPESRRRGKIVATTIRTEKCRAMFQQIRNAVKPFQQHIGGLTSVLIPDPLTSSPQQPTSIPSEKWIHRIFIHGSPTIQEVHLNGTQSLIAAQWNVIFFNLIKHLFVRHQYRHVDMET
jgi:hypothetical protein